MGMLKKMRDILGNKNHKSSQIPRSKQDAAKAHREYLKTVAVDHSMRQKHASSSSNNNKKSSNNETVLYKPIKRTFIILDKHGLLPNSQCYKYFNGNQYLQVLGATNQSVDKKHMFFALALIPSQRGADNVAYFVKNNKHTDYRPNNTAVLSIKRYLHNAGIKLDLSHHWYRLFATYSISIDGKKSLLIDLNPGFRRIQEFETSNK